MKAVVAFVIMISCTLAANLLMKSGVTGMEAGLSGFLTKLMSWKVLLGLCLLGAAAMLYLLILSWLPLNIAQSFASAQFVAVILASWIVLAEPISAGQWVGMALIAIGIAWVGWAA